MGATVASPAPAVSLNLSDVNEDGIPDLFTSDEATGTGTLYLGEGLPVARLAAFDLTTAESARNALDTMETAGFQLADALSRIGGQQSRLTSVMNVSNVMAQNYSMAAGRITDTDIAEESARMVQAMILKQTVSAVLAQANQQPRIALALLEL